MDQSDAGVAGIFPRWTNQTQAAQVYSHDGPIRRGRHRYIPTMDQSDAGGAGIFPRLKGVTRPPPDRPDAFICPLPLLAPIARKSRHEIDIVT
eukprot:5004849-Pyramimonas_sp.AAC.1